MLPLLSSRSGSPLSADHVRYSRSWGNTTPRRWSSWSILGTSCFALSLVCLCFVLFQVSIGSWGSKMEQMQRRVRAAGQAKQTDVLVLYIFSNTDPQYINNLNFFLREGVHPGDGCEYIFVINRSPDEEVRNIPSRQCRPHDDLYDYCLDVR